MFTVKATYRGQIRKLTFSGSNFPSFEELRNQVGLQLPHSKSLLSDDLRSFLVSSLQLKTIIFQDSCSLQMLHNRLVYL